MVSSDGSILNINDVCLSFGGLQVLNGVSFAVHGAEIVSLVGPNGAGKTSVLNVISGVYKPSRGSVRFNGQEILGVSPHKMAGLGIGRTFQAAELFRSMTVLDNLLVGLHFSMRTSVFSAGLFWGPSKREEIAVREKVEEVLRFLELGKYRKQFVGNLPFGVQKLIGVGRALVMKPRLLLLDEPSSGLNRLEKEDFARFMLLIKHEMGIPMLWIEHDIKMVGDLSDRVVVLHYGEKIAEGSLEDVSKNTQVVEAFLGKPA